MLYLQFKEKEPLPEHPGGVNPETGEVGGPRGPEPTRYGDWERKGRVTDFWDLLKIFRKPNFQSRKIPSEVRY